MLGSSAGLFFFPPTADRGALSTGLVRGPDIPHGPRMHSLSESRGFFPFFFGGFPMGPGLIRPSPFFFFAIHSKTEPGSFSPIVLDSSWGVGGRPSLRRMFPFSPRPRMEGLNRLPFFER